MINIIKMSSNRKAWIQISKISNMKTTIQTLTKIIKINIYHKIAKKTSIKEHLTCTR